VYDLYLDVTDEIRSALSKRVPVVALESTIIAHGMPYPQNVETALHTESIIRQAGGIPATIAILKGKIKVGLSADDIEYLGKKGLAVIKASRRDVPVLLAGREDGATTVSATMIGASMAGISVFVTGGIGGVHRGAESTMDISADLQELAHTRMAVVCAGPKSILDIGRTLEYLETMGIPVIGYQTNDLPAFYSRSSGFPVDYRADKPEDIAKIIKAQQACDYQSGLLVVNPIPERDASGLFDFEQCVQDAILECTRLGIHGKRITPFLLDKIKELSGGESLKANICLVYNNAVLGADIAKALCRL